jgi:hypothetical protein
MPIICNYLTSGDYRLFLKTRYLKKGHNWQFLTGCDIFFKLSPRATGIKPGMKNKGKEYLIYYAKRA